MVLAVLRLAQHADILVRVRTLATSLALLSARAFRVLQWIATVRRSCDW